MTGQELRAARGLLNISGDDLASASGVSIATIRRVEAGKGAGSDILESLVATFARLGVRIASEGQFPVGPTRGVFLVEAA